MPVFRECAPAPETDMNYPEYIWHNGAIKNWRDATVHVMAHGLHYGS